ncbi:response regulator [Acinetobacter qingfengensis]|uniref:histidine kinase n=1 Tax=Acinetobacter qingfengensis TaxID=1262585 RepID=A0A1E7R3B0_9GAMM|nr:ATP-binding protein [Acinetobacter qingfengensis]KAA8730858.1 response regulator [Acinetobacter qingfengensis]OEY93776.1 hybrid sensor histidine kinase/response regulator [Acinetobacter qingfengensis]
MSDSPHSSKAPQRVIKTRRDYNLWVADESIEDFALRYAPASIRKWSLWTVTNTAISTVSFLAMEAIGASILWQYGFSNAIWAAIVVCGIIFLTSWAISYYAAKYNVDVDLLTRGAGFGYLGSTITSLIYASFTFILLAFEAAIMAMALQLALHIPLPIGYLLSALVILPLVVKGVGFINKVQAITQPFWLILLFVPWGFVIWSQPHLLVDLLQFSGTVSQSQGFNLYYFGASCTLIFAFVIQIGEQADYLRFLPQHRAAWHLAVFLGGPSWIIFGFLKVIMGMLLMLLALQWLVPIENLDNPTYLYWIAYQQMIANPHIALIFTLCLVCLAQIKINVTNAYAGSLAWSNFFARLTHRHPGRLVWLIFNVFIAILLMEMGISHAVEQILGLYSNVALAWIGAVVADLIICKPLGLSPKGIEFRRAYLYDINPVGVGALLIASILSILSYLGIFGLTAQGLASFIALGSAMLCVPIIAYLSKGRYYLARTPEKITITSVATCVVCEREYEVADMASCPAYDNTICSLCCSLEARCHDLCKPHGRWSTQLNDAVHHYLPISWAARLNTRLSQYLLVNLAFAIVLAVCLSLVYLQEKTYLENINSNAVHELFPLFLKIYSILFLLASVAAWWLVLNDESRRKAEQETQQQTQLLIDEIAAHEITSSHLQEATIQAEKANEAKSRYVVGISHELRTPLNSILGYSQLLQKQEQLSVQGQIALGVISRSGQHLTSLIDGLLDLARIETGKISLNMVDLHFPNFIEQMIQMFRPQFEQKNLQFICDISPNLPQYVRTDKKRLEQVLINILGNALKFTTTGTIRLQVQYRFQTAHFEITDSGCGIADVDLERIFTPFERGSNVVQGGFTGTGLGLPIVKLLVDLLGGQLTVSSQLNVGSVFKIKLYLPSKSLVHPIMNVKSSQITGYQGQSKRILVVDNEAVDRGLMANFLEPLGFILEEAESGIECLRCVPVFQPDLILMDLNMPLMGGWETAQLLRQNHITNVPILIISAHVNEREINPQDAVLSEDFMLKPIDLNLLLSKIGDKLGLIWIDEAQSIPQNHISVNSPTIHYPQQEIQKLKILETLDQQPASLAEAIVHLNQLIAQGYIRGIQRALAQYQKDFPEQQQLWQQLVQAIQGFDLKTAKQLLQDSL